MNKELKKAWITALRSGKFNKIQGRLQSSVGHCALGVLCEVAESMGYQTERHKDTGFLMGGWLSLQPFDKEVSSDLQMSVQDMNDNQGLSFSEIATRLEDM